MCVYRSVQASAAQTSLDLLKEWNMSTEFTLVTTINISVPISPPATKLNKITMDLSLTGPGAAGSVPMATTSGLGWMRAVARIAC